MATQHHLDERSVGEAQGLKVLRVGCRNVGSSDALGSGVEVVPSLGLDKLGNDLGSDAEGGETTLNRDEPASLLDRLQGGKNGRNLSASLPYGCPGTD